ncbi:MAG: molybdopterin-guanine dinucleotide biosynthesis protein B [Promethearchaeota archaeon]
MISIKIIDVIGYSGSGKTHFITLAIKMLKKLLNYNVVVIKNVKHHLIDETGKDSYRFTESGALYSIIKNNANDVGIFLKINEENLEEVINWVERGPYKIDLFLTEGFRHLNHPTILCVKNLEDIKAQLNKNVKIISGLVISEEIHRDVFQDLPILDLEKDFQQFLEIFIIK